MRSGGQGDIRFDARGARGSRSRRFRSRQPGIHPRITVTDTEVSAAATLPTPETPELLASSMPKTTESLLTNPPITPQASSVASAPVPEETMMASGALLSNSSKLTSSDVVEVATSIASSLPAKVAPETEAAGTIGSRSTRCSIESEVQVP